MRGSTAELARLEDNLAQAVGEKASAEKKKKVHMSRLRRSRAEWVYHERKLVTDSLIAKVSYRFRRVHQLVDDLKKMNCVELWISHIKWTIQSIIVMWDDKGVKVPPEILVQLEKYMADWEAEFDALDVLDVTDADFWLSPLLECPRIAVAPVSNAAIEPALVVREFRSNMGEVTPSDAMALRTSSGQLRDDQGTPGVSQVPVDQVLVNPDEAAARADQGSVRVEQDGAPVIDRPFVVF